MEKQGYIGRKTYTKRIILGISLFGLLLAAIYGASLGLKYLKPLTEQLGTLIPFFEAELPKEKKGPKEITLSCEYKKKQYSLVYTLYENQYFYYKNNKYKPQDEADIRYGNFAEGDTTAKDLTNKIKELAKENKLSPDDTLDLAGCLLQKIPYDEVKAKKVLTTSSAYTNRELQPRYPYETLYENKGICTDKTFLALSVFKELGYSSGIFLLPDLRHMAPGVLVPDGYGSYSAKYAIFEQTNTGYKVGDIPKLNDKGLADENVYNVEKITIESIQSAKNIVTPESANQVIDFSSGNTYKKIVTLNALQKEIKSLTAEINSYKSVVNSQVKNLDAAEASVKQAESILNQRGYSYYQTYSKIYTNYLTTYNKTNQVINIYNSKVSKLNGIINQYNSL